MMEGNRQASYQRYWWRLEVECAVELHRAPTLQNWLQKCGHVNQEARYRQHVRCCEMIHCRHFPEQHALLMWPQQTNRSDQT
jgi:hypothetical protein